MTDAPASRPLHAKHGLRMMIKAKAIADYVEGELVGPDLEVEAIYDADRLTHGGLAFLTSNHAAEKLDAGGLLLISRRRKIPEGSQNSYIRVDRPRLAFARVLQKYFEAPFKPGISASARIDPDASVDPLAHIGEHVVIGANVTVGPNSEIRHNTVIFAGTEIGARCVIGANTVLGDEGFATEYTDDGNLLRMPQLGRLVIENDVVIGSGCTIARGTIHETRIGAGTKISHQVNIGHNCKIGRNCVVTGKVQISGSVEVGDRCWLGPNSVLHQKIRLGPGAKIGLGATVRLDVPENAVLMGLDALPAEEMVRWKKSQSFSR